MNNDAFLIKGGKKLFGTIEVPKAKNSYLAILSACVLCNDIVVLHECPQFSDIDSMLDILLSLGCRVDRKDRDLYIDSRFMFSYAVPSAIAAAIRSSIFLLGPITARMGKCRISYPGGCNIGKRPIDLHLKGLNSLGVKFSESGNIIESDGSNLHGGEVWLNYPSVGATENIMMTAVLCKGTTIIHNCAQEPEIVDLQDFLSCMGAKVYGGGTDTITIIGVDKLHGTSFTPIPDRIIAGTYLTAVACCGGDVTIKHVEYSHIVSIIDQLIASGLNVNIKGDNIRLSSFVRPKSIGSIATAPYPLFPTDMQPQLMVLETISQGNCIIKENLFETRLRHVPELVKMGANIKLLDNQTALVSGVDKLHGPVPEPV